MLRVVAHKSAAAALKYYSECLKREDYYSEGQEIVGKWHGKAAELLGLSGDVTPEAFAALVENRHPDTGEQLTPRMKADRRVGYDLNFHAPKSLSLLHALTGDKDILNAFRSAVAETMVEIEEQAATRVRQRGAQSERVTGNLAWAEFIHLTARPVGGIPDPHLHIHCFAFNATHDATEGRWKAASWADIKKDADYSAAVFHSRLTEKLVALGYGIQRTRQGWDISGIPRTLIDNFSRRTAQIERLAAEKGITDAHKKDALGAASREGKRHGLTHDDLLAAWSVRLTDEEKSLISRVVFDKQPGIASTPKITPEQAFDEAAEKLFAKNSVVKVPSLVAEMLRFGVGHVSPDAAWKEFNRRGMIVQKLDGEVLCTSVDILAEEVSLINFVRSGRGMFAPLASRNLKFGNEELSAEQKAAVRHILTSRDQVIVLEGKAGVGKTTAMREAVEQIEARGLKVFAFAQSASASRGTLREAGIADANTVAHLLTNKKLQERTRGQVIWIDEAGLLGIRDQWEILKLAGDGTKVILTGDTGQHAPVVRGDPFRLLQQYAGLKIARLTEIRRQEPEVYKRAVEALGNGDLRTGFRHLDEMGAIIEVGNDAERYRLLAHDFLQLSRKDHVPLVVSPTHAEGALVTAAIREAKREAGKLGAERPFIQYHDLRWEEPDRRRPENYSPGLVVQFHQNALGILRGASFRVTDCDDKGRVWIADAKGRKNVLPLKDASRFQVFEEREINITRGDQIKITRNGKSADGRRLNNGNVFTVEKFNRHGQIVLNTGAVLDAGHGHLAHGYCQTSHSAQSKSVKDVLVAQRADSLLASSREQFYVSVSRGKQSIRIYTDDRQGLQEAVGNSSTRRAGVELAGFTGKEICGLMNAELGGQQWRDLVHSRRDEGAAKNHVQNLLSERKQDGLTKSANMDFRQYVQMRRELSGADGKNRSKGHPNLAEGKKASIQNRGRSFLRPTEHNEAVKEKIAASARKKTAEVPNRQGRLKRGFEAGREHFKKISGRVKGSLQSVIPSKRQSQLPQGDAAKAAKHTAKQRVTDSAKVKTQIKAATKTATPVIKPR